MKATCSGRSVSDLVDEALRAALAEDREDLAAFDERAGEPIMSFEELLRALEADGTRWDQVQRERAEAPAPRSPTS